MVEIRRLACTKAFARSKRSALALQACVRGITSRKQFAVILAEKRKRDEEERKRVEETKKKQEADQTKKRQNDALEMKRQEEENKKKQEEEAVRKKKEEEEIAKKKKEEDDQKKGGLAKLVCRTSSSPFLSSVSSLRPFASSYTFLIVCREEQSRRGSR